MAGRLNKVFLMGNLTRDPELRYTPSGTAVTDLRLAINDDYTTSDGTRHERTVFLDVTVWARQAENCSEYLSKGRPVLVEGRLQMDNWETNEGEKRSRLKVTAENVQFLGGRGDGSNGGGQRGGGGGGGRRGRPQPAEPAPPPEPEDDDIPF